MNDSIKSFEDQTVKKVTTKLIPYLILLYILAYIGRSNLAYAALTMNVDLGITDAAFGLIAGAFFIGYFIFEVPSNIIMTKVGARIWIARILITWGLIVMATAFVQNVHHLYIARFLLGLAEAGFFPGVILYLTYWFRGQDSARAISRFMLAIPISYMIGGPLFGYVLDHVFWLNLESWRWVFLFGGLPSVIFGIITLFVLPNGPKDVKWLTDQEKEWIETTLAEENRNKIKSERALSKETLLNKPLWILVFVYFAIEMGEYGLAFWSPQVIQRVSEHLSSTQIGLFTAATYVLGAITMVWWGAHSDKKLERRNHVIIPLILAALSLVAIGYVTHSLLAVLMLALIIGSVYALFGPFWALPSMFLTGSSAAVGIAMINSFGNLAGFVSPSMIGVVGNATGNITSGFYVIAAIMVVAVILVAITVKNTGFGKKDAEKNPGA